MSTYPVPLEQCVVRRNDTAAKIDSEVVRVAKIVAAYKDVSMAEYLSEVLRPIVERDLRVYARESIEPAGGNPPKKRGPGKEKTHG